MQIEYLNRKTQFQKIRMQLQIKKYLLHQKRRFESDSKVSGGNLTKVLDFSAFEKFDFTYKENISIILEDYWGGKQKPNRHRL